MPHPRLRLALQIAATAALTLTAGVQTVHADHAEDRAARAEQSAASEHAAAVAARADADAARAQARRSADDLADAQQRLADAAERDRAAKVRASRSRRTYDGTYNPAAALWAASREPVLVANCESADLHRWPHSDGTRYLGGEKGVHLRDPNGHDGKWQFAPATWRSVGGSGRAYDATEAEQDYRAWLLWKRDGWGQWECAGKLGIR